jgi:ATP-dependent Clp protease ATP-binding subunit ClpC
VYPFERFSEDAKRVLTDAQAEAERSQHSYIGTEHLLLALLRVDSEARRVLLRLGVDAEAARASIEKVLGSAERPVVRQIIPTSRVKKVIELSFVAADREGAATVTPEHLLVALIEEGEGVAAHVLLDRGVSLEDVRRGGPEARENA